MSLSAAAVKHIRQSVGRTLQRDLATAYNVSDYTIGRVQRGLTDTAKKYRTHGSGRKVKDEAGNEIMGKVCSCGCGARLEFDTVDGELIEWCPKCAA